MSAIWRARVDDALTPTRTFLGIPLGRRGFSMKVRAMRLDPRMCLVGDTAQGLGTDYYGLKDAATEVGLGRRMDNIEMAFMESVRRNRPHDVAVTIRKMETLAARVQPAIRRPAALARR